jgi:cyclopropane-fatty-acyl-phospholipid synthase
MAIVDQVINKFLLEGGKYADFELILPNKTVKTPKSKKPEFSIVIKDNKVYKDILTRSSLGFGEQYMLGNLDIQGNMAKALEVIVKVDSSISKSNFQSTLVTYSQKVFSNSKHRSLKNVQSHYDLGNDFFKKFLDPTLTYSCAYFRDPQKDSLEKAQLQKYEHICRKLNLKKGETLIDIGCG